MDFLSAGTKKSGRCREVTVSGGSTVFQYPYPLVMRCLLRLLF